MSRIALILLVVLLTVTDKWSDALNRIAGDQIRIDQCINDDHICTRETREFQRLVSVAAGESDHARIGKINAEINGTIGRASDLRVYGIEDYWASPLETLHAGRGDCDDIAILKMVVLRDAGFAVDRLRLAVVSNGDSLHTVVLVFFDDTWSMLDTRNNTIVPLTLVRDYSFIYEYRLDDRYPVETVVGAPK